MTHTKTLISSPHPSALAATRVAVFSDPGIVLWCSASFADFCGLSAEKSVGKHLSLLVGDLNGTLQWNVNGSSHLDSTSRSAVVVTDISSPLTGKKGKLEVYHSMSGLPDNISVCFIQDETADANVLRSVETERARVTALRKNIVDNFRHELRTPVLQILGNLRLIEQSGACESVLDYVIDAKNATLRLRNMMENILDLSKLQAGVYPSEQRIANINELAEGCYMTFAPKAQQKGVRMVFVPSESEVARYLDPYAVVAAIEQLLENAVTFTHSGSIHMRVFVDEANSAHIEIEDSGIGMSTEFLPHACEPFSQEQHTMDRDYEGNGVGLALAEKLVALNRGTLHVSSTKHKGTTVLVTYPERGRQL